MGAEGDCVPGAVLHHCSTNASRRRHNVMTMKLPAKLHGDAGCLPGGRWLAFARPGANVLCRPVLTAGPGLWDRPSERDSQQQLISGHLSVACLSLIKAGAWSSGRVVPI